MIHIGVMRESVNEDADLTNEPIGAMLKRLRGNHSLRDVQRYTGISGSYLSQIERGDRRPGPSVLKRLSSLYDVPVHPLLKKAGYLDDQRDQESPDADEPLDVERAFQFVLGRPEVPRGHPADRTPNSERQALHRGDVRAFHGKAVVGMNRNLQDFCRRLAARGATQRKVPPPVLADHFCRYFKLSLRPRLAELTQVLQEAGVGLVSGVPLPQGLLGVHFSAPHWGYHIQYREDQWEAGKEHTVLHETYEIIQELLFPRRPNGDMARLICRDADKFAAAVLMQGRCFADFAEVTGLDIVEMQRLYQCSYASVTRRLAEVLEDPPPCGHAVRAPGPGRPP